MKSYVEYLQGLYHAVLVGIAEQYPALRKDCERDETRLLSLVNSRGLSFYMIDLPEMGKHFDMCLSHRLLTRSKLAGQRPYKTGVAVPRLFKGLLLRVFDESGVLRVDPDVDCIRSLRQLYYAAKKVQVQCDDSRTWKQVNEYFEIDRKIRQPTLNWDADDLGNNVDNHHRSLGDGSNDVDGGLLEDGHCGFPDADYSLPCSVEDLECAQRVADLVSATLGRFNPSEWGAKHGPGAVADQRHTQFKYDFPNWPAKLDQVFPLSEFGFANLTEWADAVSNQDAPGLFLNHEPPSRLLAVPKTLKGPRLIAAEPVAHQWCQQIIRDFLDCRLSQTPIYPAVHFRDQRFNRDAAREASHTQSHATIDLSSASDRLSCWVIERIFRRNPTLLEALHASRTRWIANTIDRKSPSFHKLRKFSSMGSACTFPVQTYTFAILAIAALLREKGYATNLVSVEEAAREVRVYGDDIIIPVYAAYRLKGMLGHLGLKVNPHKTFTEGKFRESCGLDAYDGHDVTPTYSMTYPEVSRPESIMSSVQTANNFLVRGYDRVSEYIKSRIDGLGRYALPLLPIDSGAFGYWSFSPSLSHLKSRWNVELQRTEHQVTLPASRSDRVVPERGSVLLQYFTVARRPALFLEGDRLGVTRRPSTSLRRRWVAFA